jgi:synaptosomal-associated protein 25
LGHGDSSGSATQARYKDFNENGSYENRTVEELEQYAVYKSKDTTATFNNSIKVAEEIRGDAAKTLTDLHRQGEQIRQTHNVALNIDHDLTIGEKLLGSLGGFFSKPWRPMRTRPINGPVTVQGNSIQRVGNDQEQRQALGLVKSSQRKEHTQIHPSGTGNTKACVEIEKVKQDDCLSDLSNILDQLKDMAIDMGQEIGRQNKAVDHLSDDVSELGHRIKEANARSRRLLGK